MSKFIKTLIRAGYSLAQALKIQQQITEESTS